MTNLQITFLGTGTSQGIPMIGCDCMVCASADPRDRRSRSSVYMQSPELSWVIDTGPDFRAQCLREKISKLDAILYTHSHTDHIMGFDDLRRFCEFRGGGIPIYAAPATMADLQRVFAFAFSGEHRYPGYVIPDPVLIEDAFFLEETEIIPLEVPHGRANTTGFLFRREGAPLFAYLSDCNAVPDDVIETIRGVSALAIDALRHRPHPTHLSIDQALEVARKCEARQTYFTHMCHDLSHEQVSKDLPEGVAMAFDGLKIAV